MYNKLCLLTCFIVLFSIANIVAAVESPVAFYQMEEGSGTIVGDSTGNGHNGTIVGSLVWGEGAPDFGGGLVYDGVTANYVQVGTFNPLDPATNKIAGTAWIKWAGSTTWTVVAGKSSGGSMMFQWLLDSGGQYGVTVGGGFPSYGTIRIIINEWTHVAFSNDGTQSILYINGNNAGTITQTFDKTLGDRNFYIGSVENPFIGRIGFNGTIDELAFFNTSLTQADVQDIMSGALAVKGPATGPNPSKGAKDVPIDGTLSWKAGPFASKHNIFFGTSFDGVNDGTALVAQGQALDVNTYDPGIMEYGTTYYWRVDEVNDPAASGTYTGKIWSFKTELEGYPLLPASIINVTSYGDVYPDEPDRQDPNSTCTGAGLDANDMHGTNMKTMWLGMDEGAYLQYEFDKVYKFYNMLVWNYNEETPNNEYFGAKDVKIEYSLDGENWTEVADVPEFNIASGDNKCIANTDVLFNGANAKYIKLTFLTGWGDLGLYGISEVRFSAEPTRATVPVPANAATGISVNPVLSWKVGRYAVDHNVYLSTDVNAVKGGTANMVARSDANYPPALALTKTYYWRVDEVNNAEAYPVWDGPVWSFSTATTIIVDNFETGYGNTEANFVWATWKDGVEVPANGGSEVGKGIDPPGLSTVFRSGTRSLVFSYNNSGANTYSQVTAQSIKLPIKTTDWSIGSPAALVIYFRGEPNNVPAQMYAKINNAKVTYTGDPGYLSQSVWRPFVIDLSTINTTLSNVSSITIGLENIGTQVGVGNIYIDDIALYGVAPVVVTTPVNPGNTGLIASYSMENNVQDGSGKGLHGTIVGTPTYENGATGYGKALKFNGTTDCVDLGNKAEFNPEGSFSVSLWANISTWTSAWGHVMVANRGEGTVGWQIRRNSDNRMAFTTRGISNDDMTSNANPPPLNEWIQITCVYDSAAFTKSIYLDGALDRTVNLTGTVKKIPASTHNTYIGARANNDNTLPEGFFAGMIDQVRIYNRALSAGEAVYLADPTP
jgi:hypothetical protein